MPIVPVRIDEPEPGAGEGDDPRGSLLRYSSGSWARRKAREGPRSHMRRAPVRTPSRCSVASRCTRSTMVVVVVIPWCTGSCAALVPAFVRAPSRRLLRSGSGLGGVSVELEPRRHFATW